MLFDPKWEVQTKPDVFSIEGLIAWLEKQPAGREYDWANADMCLLGQWCAANGLLGEELRSKSMDLGGPNNWDSPVYQAALGDLQECTFGAALTRARAALAGA